MHGYESKPWRDPQKFHRHLYMFYRIGDFSSKQLPHQGLWPLCLKAICFRSCKHISKSIWHLWASRQLLPYAIDGPVGDKDTIPIWECALLMNISMADRNVAGGYSHRKRALKHADQNFGLFGMEKWDSVWASELHHIWEISKEPFST